MRRLGLIGNPLGHSFSASWFKAKFQAERITDALYENYELPSLEDLLLLFEKHKDLCGLNVTIPYKEQVLPYLDEQSHEVRQIGACNCIHILEGRSIGYNTDAYGFRNSLEPLLNAHHKKALVLGTGGASKAVIYVLNQLGIKQALVSRRPSDTTISYADVTPEVLQDHLLIINTTPVGTYPIVDEAPPLPYHLLTEQHLLFDLVYNPPTTKFLALGTDRGAQISNGQRMLELQAEESWRIWNTP